MNPAAMIDVAARPADLPSPAAPERFVPSTDAQREIWLGSTLSTQASLAYNLSLVLRFKGALDTRALMAALGQLVNRHESLRAVFSFDGEQILISQSTPVAPTETDLRHLPSAQQSAQLEQEFRAVVLEPFQLDQGPLFRAKLLHLSATEHVLVLSAHHAICDGWSWEVIQRDLEQIYAQEVGESVGVKPAAQFSDYARWTQKEVDGEAMRDHVSFWRSRFDGRLPVLDLPLDRPRPSIRTYASRRIDRLVPQETIDALRKTGASFGTSLFSMMFSAFAILLNRLSGQDDLVIGIPTAGQVQANMPSMVGHCANCLPIRTSVDKHSSFEEFLRNSSSVLLDAMEHQALTYSALLREIAVPRDPSRLPLVSVLFNLQTERVRKNTLAELVAEKSTVERLYENFELFLNVAQVGGAMQLELQYNTDLFDEETARRWVDMYEVLLRAVVRQPLRQVGRFELLSPEQAAATAGSQYVPVAQSGRPLMHARFVDYASPAFCDRPALRVGAQRMSYRELDESSNQLAHALRAHGVGRGHLVGICLERNADMVRSMLAVLKCGGAYVPLDPAFPKSRLDYYAQDAQLSLLLTSSAIDAAPLQWRPDAKDRVFQVDQRANWELQPRTPLPAGPMDAQAEDPAYVIYTSGSTGKPKGVCVPHRAVANFLQSMARTPGIHADDRLAAVTTLSFDIAVLELLLPLSNGAEVILVPRDTSMDGRALRSLIEDCGATIMQATPSTWRLLLDAQWRGRTGFKGLIGGESLPSDLALALSERCELWNMYGPTETTVWSTLWRVDPQRLPQGVSIGLPIDNTTVFILDDFGQRCPIGITGEICIGGKGVALGYLNRPDITAEKFVADPSGELLYRTGDLGRWRNDGLLEHRGRSDFQVKVRGYRIELGEIENCCNELSSVGSSVVVTREDQPGDVRLVAYLCPKPGASIDQARLDQILRDRLPHYMVPQHLVVLDALPLLPNGKIDRKALPAPIIAARESVSPRSQREHMVASVMERVLNMNGLGIHDDFFDMGGHSMLAARVTTQLSELFGIRIPLRALFEHPTVNLLSTAIESMQAVDTPQAHAISHDPARSAAPLTPMQQRICFVEALHPGRAAYNVPSAHRLTGHLDVPTLEASLREIVRRQAVLRSCIGTLDDSATPVQLFEQSVAFELAFEDLQSIAQQRREAVLQERMQVAADAPLDLHRAPMFRAALFQLDADEHVLVFVPHHLVWDGWSTDVLISEIDAVYGAYMEGRPSPLPDLNVTYGDYAAWYENWLAGAEAETQLAYWKQRFSTVQQPVLPQSDMPRRAGMSGQGRSCHLRVAPDTTQALRLLAQSHGVTINMMGVALLSLMMSRAIDSSSVVVGVPVRGREMPHLEYVMGFFNNLLLMPFELRGSWTLAEYLAAVKGEYLASMDHQRIPFERLASEPEFVQRTQNGAALYQVLFSFQDARERNETIGGLRHESLQLMQSGATDDFGVWMTDCGAHLEVAINYNSDIFHVETGEAFRDRYHELLTNAATMPSATLDMLSAPGDSAAAMRLARLAPSRSHDIEIAKAARRPERDSVHQLLMPEQASLAQVWATVLNIDVNDIRATDNFFDLGGDSLLAMRAVEQGEQAMGLRIEPRRYVYESLAQLSARSGIPAPVAVSVEIAPAQGLFGRMMSALGRR